jgi:hypothetical protein
MKMDRFTEHAIIALLLSFIFALVLRIPEPSYGAFLFTVFAGMLLPDADSLLGMGHRNALMHSFVVPVLLLVFFPGNLVAKAVAVGYLAHMVADIEKPCKDWKAVRPGNGPLVLWISVVVILLALFGADLFKIGRASCRERVS